MNRRRLFLGFTIAALAPTLGQAQFTSGSTGSDGALNLTTPGTVIFDPTAFNPPLDPAGDNVFNFTTINIGAGVTVVMQAHLLRNKSVIWLATGDVTIAGMLSLSGGSGAVLNSSNPGLTRSPSEPGPGGFPGGVGGYLGQPAQPGSGYGGGTAGALGGTTGSNSGGYAVYQYYNSQLTPLVGGAGGGGGGVGTGGTAGGTGGAGAGAIRIVSSTSISLTGTINAYGGYGSLGVVEYQDGNGGSGSGGAVHLIAPTISGNGTIDTDSIGNPDASNGVVQFNATTNTFTGSVAYDTVYYSELYNPPALPAGLPSVRVVSVDNVAAPMYPTASYGLPDVVINASGKVAVTIAAQNIPLGTTVTLHLTSQSGPDSVATCAPLTGTLASSTAKCGVSFPTGVTITEIEATY